MDDKLAQLRQLATRMRADPFAPPGAVEKIQTRIDSMRQDAIRNATDMVALGVWGRNEFDAHMAHITRVFQEPAPPVKLELGPEPEPESDDDDDVKRPAPRPAVGPQGTPARKQEGMEFDRRLFLKLSAADRAKAAAEPATALYRLNQRKNQPVVYLSDTRVYPPDDPAFPDWDWCVCLVAHDELHVVRMSSLHEMLQSKQGKLTIAHRVVGLCRFHARYQDISTLRQVCIGVLDRLSIEHAPLVSPLPRDLPELHGPGDPPVRLSTSIVPATLLDELAKALSVALPRMGVRQMDVLRNWRVPAGNQPVRPLADVDEYVL